tara:strand:- start:1779 stop:2069 length:291 start_codon:yes stop_codon:yes gene_type:complete
MSNIANALSSLGVTGFSLKGNPTTEEEFKAAFTGTTSKTWAEIKAEADKIAYKDVRAKAYPSIQDQLDMQYWDKKNGTTTWVDAVAKVKSDNPKPS